MGSISDTSSSLKPIYEAKPDMRYATTFLSNKFRDYAVKGESLQDKITGEIFTKRKEDGRVVSFFHNKKYLQDTMFELRILLVNNPSFRRPASDDVNAQYLAIDYDAMSLFDDKEVDIKGRTVEINNTSDKSVHHIEFKLSKNTNGFFVTAQTRDDDKTIIEWLSTHYNALLANYNGDSPDLIAEHNRFVNNERWITNNSIINYTIEITTGINITTYTFEDFIRMNETSCVLFPSNFDFSLFDDADEVKIYINSIDMHKANFVLNNLGIFPASVTSGISKFIAVDNKIQLRYIGVARFIDNVSDIELLGNEFICTMLDMTYIANYLSRVAKLVNESTLIFSPTRPADDIWPINTLWAEQVRDVFKGGYEVDMNSEINLKLLEAFLADNDDTDYVSLTEDDIPQDILVHMTEGGD